MRRLFIIVVALAVPAITWGLAVTRSSGAPDAEQPADKPLAFRGARILPVSGEPIDDGVFIVHKGKVVAVGPKGTRIPDGADVRDVPGTVIIPGLVDTHSHIGIYPRPSVPAHGDGNEMSG